MKVSLNYPPDLPISARREEIVVALRAHPVVIVAGETGSGKTTQLPKMCLEAMGTGTGTNNDDAASPTRPRGRIGCTQPRRVAALSVSRRVAEELGVTWGREVGCKIRFGDDTGRDTRVKFMTDGILLAEIQSDPLLRAYSTLIIDEAHERSLNIDFLLGYLQELLRRRPHDLKVVITSATIDTSAFSEAFGGAPVIEVSGRLFPVEIHYAPPASFRPDTSEAADAEEAAELSHIQAAVHAAENALLESDDGDVLIFLPTEREINECRDGLERTLGKGIEVIGLFGRMPAAEQTRIFSPGPRRRVIVATNIAETSLTIPRIRYVIDAGLARMSRYNPRTRTKRLPVEPVSQSSANQRAGRAGRLRDGICIRLYDQEDYEKRPRFTQPEIQRANLAEVILRMKAFRLGEIETFPFLNPPLPAAIHAGYGLLHELGALDDAHVLTPLGRELARLPLDPTLGRMLLQARHEGALEEMLIIAAGLSVPDPREWPDDARDAANTAHRAFVEPRSDFLTLLKLWRALPDGNSRNALRRFAKTNYLSQSRLREWREVHHQLADTMREPENNNHPYPPGPRPSTTSAPTPTPAAGAGYDAIHRSILAGLLGQIAQRRERNIYLASGNRQTSLFPGSGLYQRKDKPLKPQRPPVNNNDAATNHPPARDTIPSNAQPAWIVAGEIVQTSQLFARTAGGIDPQWVAELGAHLCKFSYSDPHWNVKAARVLAWERVLLYGLEVVKRRIDYGKIDAALATELFIRGALVAGEASIEQRFFAHNQTLREKIEAALTRIRNRRVEDLDEALYRFYAARIAGVSSVHDLNRLVRERLAREPGFLCATEDDLIGAGEDGAHYDREQFPEGVSLGTAVLPLAYAYAPGEERDGVTVQVPLPIASQLTTGQLQWMVPGLREEQISVLLRALPKSIRRPLMPLDEKVPVIAREFQPGRGVFLAELATYLTRRYGVEIAPSDWPPESLPAHLLPRVEVVDRESKTVASSRDLAAIQSTLAAQPPVHSDAWERAVRRWERADVSAWNFGDLPASVVVEEIHGAALLAYPGLTSSAAGDKIDVHLFRRPEEAVAQSGSGVRHLAERVLARDLAWVHKELGGFLQKGAQTKTTPQDFRSALDTLRVKGPAAKSPPPGAASAADALHEATYRHVVRAALTLEPVLPLTEARFQTLVTAARRDLPLLARRTGEAVVKAVAQRAKILASGKAYPALPEDLRRLLPPDFPANTTPAQLAQLPRYLRAVEVRAERAALQPAKDAEKARLLAGFSGWEARVPAQNQEAFRALLEEYRVSIFAQELGTAQPVSAQRLKALETA